MCLNSIDSVAAIWRMIFQAFAIMFLVSVYFQPGKRRDGPINSHNSADSGFDEHADVHASQYGRHVSFNLKENVAKPGNDVIARQQQQLVQVKKVDRFSSICIMCRQKCTRANRYGGPASYLKTSMKFARILLLIKSNLLVKYRPNSFFILTFESIRP